VELPWSPDKLRNNNNKKQKTKKHWVQRDLQVAQTPTTTVPATTTPNTDPAMTSMITSLNNK